jgi:hypothetical protein
VRAGALRKRHEPFTVAGTRWQAYSFGLVDLAFTNARNLCAADGLFCSASIGDAGSVSAAPSPGTSAPPQRAFLPFVTGSLLRRGACSIAGRR